jgi:hypothetical protein
MDFSKSSNFNGETLCGKIAEVGGYQTLFSKIIPRVPTQTAN